MNWNWLEMETILAVHDQLVDEHGGIPGVRDMGLLESAPTRPKQLASYQDHDIFDLAAAYAWGIARDHPFLDGNKRTAYVACILFLRLHAIRIEVDGAHKVLLFERLGKGDIPQDTLAAWLRARQAAK